MALEDTAQDERGQGDRALERVPDQVDEVVRPEARLPGDTTLVGVQPDGEVRGREGGPDRLERWVIEVPVRDVRPDLDATDAG